GSNVSTYPAIAQQVAARGYGIGNHSMSHQYTPSTIANEIVPANDVIERVTGVRPATFRSPGLTPGPVIQQRLASVGMCTVFTRFDIGDWVSPRISAATICARIRANAQPGDVILLHDGGSHGPTVQAMQSCVIETLQEKGLSVVSEDDLFNGTV